MFLPLLLPPLGAIRIEEGGRGLYSKVLGGGGGGVKRRSGMFGGGRLNEGVDVGASLLLLLLFHVLHQHLTSP